MVWFVEWLRGMLSGGVVVDLPEGGLGVESIGTWGHDAEIVSSTHEQQQPRMQQQQQQQPTYQQSPQQVRRTAL